MPYRVQFTPDAAENLRALRAGERACIVDHCQRFLSANRTLESQARIKRLREGYSLPIDCALTSIACSMMLRKPVKR